jgi:signal peptidase I
VTRAEIDQEGFSWADHYGGTQPAGTASVRVAGQEERARLLLEWMVVAIVALVVTMVLRAFVLAAFFIPSESMLPTLEVHDRVLVNKLSYKVHDVNRGDIVVFKRPPGEPDQTIKDLIKRVVGVPGDEVSFVDGKVFVNGQELIEPYLAQQNSTFQRSPETIVVPEGQVLVLGDNRQNSFDGRMFGTFSQDLIVGRAFIRVWPASRMGAL